MKVGSSMRWKMSISKMSEAALWSFLTTLRTLPWLADIGPHTRGASEEKKNKSRNNNKKIAQIHTETLYFMYTHIHIII